MGGSSTVMGKVIPLRPLDMGSAEVAASAQVAGPQSLEWWAGELCRSVRGFQSAVQTRSLLLDHASTPEMVSMHKVLDAVHDMASRAAAPSQPQQSA